MTDGERFSAYSRVNTAFLSASSRQSLAGFSAREVARFASAELLRRAWFTLSSRDVFCGVQIGMATATTVRTPEVIRWWHATACIGIIYNVEYSQTQAPKSRQLTAIHVSIRGATIRTIDPFPSAISCESMAGNSVPKSTVTLVPFGIVRTIRFM